MVELRRNPGTQRGSVLVLVPALALVALALLGTAVDLVALHAAQRRCQTILASAADDAAAMLDARRIQLDGVVVVDPVAARRTVVAHLATTPLPGRTRRVDVVTHPDRVEVLAQVEVGSIVLRALPGLGGPTLLTARATGAVTP